MKFFVKGPPKVRYHQTSKVNKLGNVHRCAKCLELSTFRVFQANGVNRIACVICLNSSRFHKHKKISEHNIILQENFTLKHWAKRIYVRAKTYLLGNHIYGPFKRRRKNETRKERT